MEEVSGAAYFSARKTKLVYSSEMSANVCGLHGFRSQKTVLFTVYVCKILVQIMYPFNGLILCKKMRKVTSTYYNYITMTCMPLRLFLYD
jgi:hypothetical protein